MAQPEGATQPAEKRKKNFAEVSFGLSKKIAIEEARRYPQHLNTTDASVCPIGVDVPGFIRILREGNVAGAYEKVREANCLPAICGRVCPAPCENAFASGEHGAPIGIRALERFVSDHGRMRSAKKASISNSSVKIAIIGSGPAGLAAANELVASGHRVTIYESLDKPGGVLRYGIPEFRIPEKILDQDIKGLINAGVEIKTNFFVSQTVTIDELFKEGYKIILLATGAGIPKFMDLPGANLGGVYYGEEFLMRANLTKRNLFGQISTDFKVGPRLAVIGSGNTALDCARVGVRYGCDVTLIFRGTEEDLRVRESERKYAREEGVRFQPLTKSLEILGDQENFVKGLRCIQMDYADTQQNDQWELVQVPDSEFTIEADSVVIAIGHEANAMAVRNNDQIKIDSDGTINANESSMTSIPGIFACGNIVTNAGNIVEAMASGKQAAKSIDEYLKK